MVYCSKCGTQNPDNATVCSNCGAPLYTVGQQYPGSEREHYRRVEGECFGLPYGGVIASIVFGINNHNCRLRLVFASKRIHRSTSGPHLAFNRNHLRCPHPPRRTLQTTEIRPNPLTP